MEGAQAMNPSHFVQDRASAVAVAAASISAAAQKALDTLAAEGLPETVAFLLGS